MCICVHLWFLPLSVSAQQRAKPKEAASPLAQIDVVVEKAIAADEIPGAVVLVGQGDKILYRKAYGNRSLIPQREAMTMDTIFDMASLTKVVATTPSVMKLVEQGLVRLNDPVAKYIPEFGANGKEDITVRHLMTHTGGLRPIPRLPEKWSGTDDVLKAIYEDSAMWGPGMRFVYSDCDFIVLGEIVRRVSGIPLDEFAAKNIFEPLGMKHTRFNPPKDWIPNIAPTEEIDLPAGEKAGSGKGHVLRGVVHDPRARGMNGVAGHAGLFSTADDLAIYCQRLLEPRYVDLQGRNRPHGHAKFLDQDAVAKMISVQTPSWMPTKRGLGWDIDSAFSAPRGELFPIGSFGHTGFTGTSIWLDPTRGAFVILLTSSVHPRVRPAISSLRSKVSSIVPPNVSPLLPDISVQWMRTLLEFPSPMERIVGSERPFDLLGVSTRNAETKSGIDVLIEENFATLKGKRVGLITNHTGVARDGRSTIDVLAKAEGVKLVALFSPEHGIAGREDSKVASDKDAATGLVINSLYGDTRRPTDEMLKGVDALVFDIQDAGVRFYT
ncbi:MAG: serine hydrolase, partial [Acidobacteria bacterium]|nr:serine hydrolase [Acidobacteriota bacterium]